MFEESAKVGDRMEVHHKFAKKPVKAYVSQIQDILGPNQFVAYAPMEYGQIIKLPNGDGCSVLIFTEKGIIKFDAEILKNVVKENVYYIVLRVMDEGERIQRRDFFRFDCVLDFTFGIVDIGTLNEETRKHVLEECKMQGIIKDLGGGGIRFLSNDDIDEKVDICCVIPLESEVILPIGKVLHKQYFPKSNYTYQYRAQFYDMPQHDQEKVVQYIFNEQRKILRRTRDYVHHEQEADL